MKIVVLGCGAAGLSSAVRLREAGFEVEIWARDLPPHTTSDVAAAVWYPYHAHPAARVIPWGRTSFEEFSDLARVPGSGVAVTEGMELFRDHQDEPAWRPAVGSFRFARPDELPNGFQCAWIFETPVIDTSIYLTYLMERFRRSGGSIRQASVQSLDDVLETAEIVVNCSGLGAHHLVPDQSVIPARGQIVVTRPVPFKRFYLEQSDPEHPVYIVPRTHDCILGGTYQEGHWELQPDPSTACEIVERCAALTPEVREAQIVDHRVGLRPVRAAVRLERETRDRGRIVIHNYGHGGAGVTLSWGCADEVTALARSAAGMAATEPP